MKNKKILASVTCILLMAISSLIAIAPTIAYYAPPPTEPTGTFVGISPTLIGLGQQTTIYIMITPAPRTPSSYVGNMIGVYGNAFQNVSVTIVEPDGTKNTYMPIDAALSGIGVNLPGATRIDGNLYFVFTPDQVGNYTFTASFPGQTFTNQGLTPNSTVANQAVYYTPSTSNPTILTVQQDKVTESGILTGWPYSPLPTNYWENPVSTNNREWSAISGAWIQTGYDAIGFGTYYNPYSTAPMTPHIAWKRQVSSVGLSGGIWGSLAYNLGSLGAANVILDGKIYASSTFTPGAIDCIDLRTGQLLWTKTTSISGGNPSQALQIILPYQTSAQTAQGGVLPVILQFGFGQWGLYDAFNLAPLSSFNSMAPSKVENVPYDVGGIIGGPKFNNGDPVTYLLQAGPWNNTQPLNLDYAYLIKWNLTKLISRGNAAFGAVSNEWKNGVEWNVSIRQPDGSDPGVRAFSVIPGVTLTGIQPYYIPNANVVVVQGSNGLMGFSASTGNFLWNTSTPTSQWWGTQVGPIGPEPYGPIMFFDGAKPGWTAYDVRTGKVMWSAAVGATPWSNVMSSTYAFHNGTFYTGNYDGHVYALDTATGIIKWVSDWTGKEDESVYGNQPFNGGSQLQGGTVGANGVLYVGTGTTYFLEPRTRFHELYAINEADGSFMWKLPIGIGPSSIAYGYLVGIDAENGVQYSIGKGKTATTVSAPMTSVPSGKSLMIQGTVMDLSPAQPNTPAISDKDMSEWMDYLHGQNATLINTPPKPTGVEVSLIAVDPNGNTRDLGTTTSDYKGFFSTTWTPDVPGKYTVYASFAGSESYWSSSAVTAFTVDEAPQAEVTPEPLTLPPLEMYITVGVALIIIAIAIVGILMLRKK